MHRGYPCIPVVAVKQAITSCVAIAWEWLAAQCTAVAHASAMACYTAEGVAQLFEEDGNALDTICMDGSDDELGLEDVEVVQNPYHYHVAEFEDFEEIEGIVSNNKYTQC